MNSLIDDHLSALVAEGVFRFEGRHEGTMDPHGKFVLPEDWDFIVSQDNGHDFLMVYDELAGEIFVYFEEDEPSYQTLKSVYRDFVQSAREKGAKISERDISPYPYMNHFDHVYKDGAAKISPKVLRGLSVQDIGSKPLADKPFDIVVKGFGRGFTISRADDGWKKDRSAVSKDKRPLWARVFAVRPVIKGIRSLEGPNPLEAEMLSTIRPLGRGQNQIDQPFDDASGVLLQELIEPS